MTKKRKNQGKKKSKNNGPSQEKQLQRQQDQQQQQHDDSNTETDDKQQQEQEDSKFITPLPLPETGSSGVLGSEGNVCDKDKDEDAAKQAQMSGTYFEHEEDEASSLSSSSSSSSGVWQRRGSVLDSVAEIEKLPLMCEDGEERVVLPGSRALPGLAAGHRITSSSSETGRETVANNLCIDTSVVITTPTSTAEQEEKKKEEEEEEVVEEEEEEQEQEEESVRSRSAVSAVSAWRRRGSVKETVVEIEQQLLGGAIFPLPGGNKKQQHMKVMGMNLSMEDINSGFVHRPSSGGEGDSEDISTQTVMPQNVIQDRSKSACVLDWKPFDIMDTRPASCHLMPSQGSMDETDTNGDTDTNTAHSLLLKSLNKLVRVLFEFQETEIKFSMDVNSLKAVLSEIKYSTMSTARLFVSSVSYVGILVATESIKITSNLLVNLCQESKISPSLDLKGNVLSHTDVSECLECCEENCKAIFNGLERCAPFFPLYASFIINHDGLSQSYRELIESDEDFKQYISSAEMLVGETLLSLLIKPVQRLPRYVLLCREIHSSISKAMSLLDENDLYFEQLNALFLSSKKILASMTGFTATCNESVRTHQDNLRMHSLKLAFEDSGTDDFGPDLLKGFVSNKRRIIREGQLLRHHKHRAASHHEFQIFSDLMLSSAAVGTSLKLEHVVMLGKACNTICFAIPAMFDIADSSWFFICSQKILFCCAGSSDKRDLWVKDLSKCLITNQADSDKYLMKKQIALVNAIISQINMLWRQIQQTSEEVKSLDKEEEGEGEWKRDHRRDSSSSSMDPVWIQVSWWRLLGILKALEAQAQAAAGSKEAAPPPSSSLQRVIDMHAREVTNRILQSIGVVDTADDDHPQVSRAASYSPRSSSRAQTQGSLATLLLNPQPHYLIATGFFFEACSYGAGSSLSDGVRPLILRLFLLSDVLVATYFETVAHPLRYAFHICMKDLQCSDFSTADDVGPTAIQLIDQSVKLSTRRFSLFSKSGPAEQKKRERILFAPTVEMKFDWLALLMQTVDNNQEDVPLAPGSLKINKIPLPLQRVGTLCSTSAWEYEHNMAL